MNRKKINYMVIALIAFVIGAIIFVGYVNRLLEEEKKKTATPAPAATPKPGAVKDEIRTALPMLAIVIDDIGNSKELGEEALKLRGVTLAVIPELKYSLYFAEKGKSMGKEILVHIPMQPQNADKYSSDSELLKTDMSRDDILKLTEKFLNAVPYAAGANNHMGSKFTEDEEKMRVFLEVLKQKRLFFLDSRTSAESKAGKAADGLGIRNFKRDVFLDNVISEDKISEQLDKAVSEAYKNGFAVAIGHPHKETIAVLKRRLGDITKKVEIVSLSGLNAGKQERIRKD